MIIELNKISNKGIFLDEDVFIKKELYSKAPINDLKNVHIKGIIKYDYENNLLVDLNVSGVFNLNDTKTLDDIDYPFMCQIEEKITNIEKTYPNFYEKSQNRLDISEILWENIVLEIPIRATTSDNEDFNLVGNGWEYKNKDKKEIDPRLAKLTMLLDEKEE